MSRGRVIGVVSMLMASVTLVTSKPRPSEPFDHQAVLAKDDTYHMFWKFDEKSITFEVHVKTKGYVGFGLSPNGGMKDSDIVIGWVKDGKAYFQDRFAEQHGRMPTLDPQQDWELLSGTETDSRTVLKFRRNLIACDERDRTIGKDTVRVIWAYHSDDPESVDRIPYHEHNHRGVKSIYLIQQVSAPSIMPSDAITQDFLMNNVTLPSDDTTYWCRGFVVPAMAKHHAIKMEPIVQAGNENTVHHIILYQCSEAKNASHHSREGTCESRNMYTGVFKGCQILIYGWAVGGEAQYLPSLAGVTLGGTDDPGYFVLQIHYDNPTKASGIVDSSGARITMTPSLRANDAGVLIAGGTVTLKWVIPPKYKALTSRHICGVSCLGKVIPDEGIKVFSSFLHTHLLGVEVQVYHFRNGEQLMDSDLGTDHSYDFNYQEYRPYAKEITVLRNDTLVIDCVYDSSKRKGLTLAGDSTKEEMCLAFLMYYPKIPLSKCASVIHPNHLVHAVNGNVQLRSDGYVSKPASLANRTWLDLLEKEVDWNQQSKRQKFQDVLLTADQVAMCVTDEIHTGMARAMNVTRQTGLPPASACRQTSGSQTVVINCWLIISISLALLKQLFM